MRTAAGCSRFNGIKSVTICSARAGEARLEGLQREIDLEDDGFAVGGGHFISDNGLGFVDFCASLQKFDAGKDADGVARRLLRRHGRARVGLGCGVGLLPTG